ncbi:MAG: Hpt domain-containing protein, partial [Giesbergeria sp.]
VTLGEAERSMDQFFRNPEDTAPLAAVPSRLAQMRGVLSVLGLDQASLAVLRMRDTVERLLIGDVIDSDERKALFERLGNSLGALGFMIDMLSYQRAMARKLFVYDEELGELRLIAGRARTRATDSAVDADDVAHKVEERAAVPLPDVVPRVDSRTPLAALSPEASPELPSVETAPVPTAEMSVEESLTPSDAVLAASSAEPAAAQIHVRGPEVEDELLEIFLEEAREVVENGLGAVSALQAAPGDLSEQTTLRRAFHTLKGSSRMVGLNRFGEAAWSMEQLLNAWLAEQKPMERPLLDISRQAMQGFSRWAQDIEAGDDSAWDEAAFRTVAEAMRLDGKVLALELPTESGGARAVSEAAVVQESQPLADGHAVEVEHDFVITELEFGGEALLPPAGESPLEMPAESLGALDFDFTGAGPVEIATEVPVEAVAITESSEIDFSEFEAALDVSIPVDMGAADDSVSLPKLEEAEVAADGQRASDRTDLGELPVEMGTPEGQESGAQDAESEMSVPVLTDEAVTDDSIKVIGHLRIGIPLYNVYLNEADEWSRRLATCLQEWALELHERLPDAAVALAHSLAGSSATVGVDALSQTARLLEHALEHVQLQPVGEPEQAAVFLRAADEVRRLLHQFAAGFLKPADEEIHQELRSILETEICTTLSPPLAEADAVSPAKSSAAESDIEQQTQGEEPQAELPEVVQADPVVLVPASVVPEPVISEIVVPGVVAPALSVAVRERGQPGGDLRVRAAVQSSDLDEDIDAIDAIDSDLFPIFEEEAAELLPKLGSALRQWTERPDNLGARSEVLRALHTLKGSSRLAGAMRLGEMAHRLESAIEALDAEAVTSEEIEPLLGSFDALQANFRVLRAVDGELKDDAVEPLATASPSPSQTPEETEAPSSRVQSSILVRPLGAPKASAARAAAQHSVRVRAQLLDRLVNQAGEVMITRSRLESRLGLLKGSMGDLSINLDRLRQQLRDIEVQSESQMQSRLALSKDSAAGFDPLEFDRFTRVQELTRMMAESVNDVATVQRNLQRVVEGTEDDLIAQGRQARELQRDLLRTRMVEFEGIAERLYAVVRQSSKETGKQIK